MLAAQDTGAIFAVMSEALTHRPAAAFGATTNSEAATEALAGVIAGLARTSDVIALSGDIGAGKTVFARGFVRSLTAADEEVPSPTFTLVQTYESAHGPIHHYDLYRIDTLEDAREIGIEDSFADAITLIEWPERIAAQRGANWLDIEFSMDASAPEIRRLTFRAGSAWREQMADPTLLALGLEPAAALDA